ncbi:MAG: glycosyltransferase family 4 protein [Chloroflexota bacterium]|nr:glycosyltransferase family 4 protein [Chloroflexota bacterium]
MTDAIRPPLRVGIDARSRTGSTGGVQQFTVGLLHSLHKLPAGDQEYLALSYADDREWLAPAIGEHVRLLDAPLPALRRGLIGAVRRAALARAPFLRGVRARVASRVAGESLPRSDGTIERAGVEVMHFVRQDAFLTDLPSLYHPWDLQHLHLPQFFTDEQRRRRDITYRAFCERADRIVAASSWTKADLVKSLGIAEERIIVIPVAQHPEAYPATSATGLAAARAAFGLPDRFLLYPAQTWPHKNHLRLIEAIAHLRDAQGRSVNLVLTGYQNEHYPQIRAQIDRHRLSEQIRCLGYVTPTQLQALYRLAVGLIFPSLFEGWGIPIVEAFQAGTAVACSDATSLPSMVGDAALVFDPHDVESIASAATALWDDEALRRQLIERGTARLRLFDPERVAETYRALYRLVAGRSMSPGDEPALSQPPAV